MTIEELKNNLKRISLEHKQIIDFQYGEDFLLATEDKRYPLSFLEIPYNITYDLVTKQRKEISFALLILMNPTDEDIVEDHILISKAEIVAESMVRRMRKEFPQLGFILTGNNLVSVREFGDDNAAGIRIELTGTILSTICDNNYMQHFNN